MIFLFLSLLLPLSAAAAEQAVPDVDAADNRVAAEFARAAACLADRQWGEAVEILRGVMENSGGRLWPVTRWRYITVREYCQMQLAALPPEALAIYRGQVDPAAESWYREGFARRDRAKLLLVAERAFASSYGDDALLALGEMALARGDYTAARGYWEKILPFDGKEKDNNKTPGDTGANRPAAWLSHPDSDIDPAVVRSRLVLASILEGSLDRAQQELDRFKQLHAEAAGRFGGSETNFAQALERILNESRSWPPPKESRNWPTFAGSQRREKIAPEALDAAGPAWRIHLRKSWPNDRAALNFYPIVVDNMVFVPKAHEILGLDLRTGRPLWGQAGAAVFRDKFDGETAAEHGEKTGRVVLGLPEVVMREAAGTVQYTMTAAGGLLLCRMESPDARSDRVNQSDGGYLIALDLESEGRLLWRIDPENADWAFEGAPVGDGANVYAALRLNGARPQAYVACFDAQTGRRRWLRFICGAEAAWRAAPSRQLLTLAGERIYYNTNLGAVAAIAGESGELQWLSLYPRAKRPDPSAGAAMERQILPLRDPNPCLFHRGVLYVGPSDSRRIFAFDAVTGQILWQSGPQIDDVQQLLGVAGENLIASGRRLYWIGTGTGAGAGDGGKLNGVWPLAGEGPGYGRGVLADRYVYWPTREKIFVFEQKTARLVDTIELKEKNAGGGNLVAAQERLLIAAPGELFIFTNVRSTER